MVTPKGEQNRPTAHAGSWTLPDYGLSAMVYESLLA